MNELKELYNHTLFRYYNGCNYIEQHVEECDKYLPEVMKLLATLNKILEKIPDATEWEVLNGFEM